MAKKLTRKPPVPDEQFIVRSTGCHIKLVSVDGDSREYAYLNRSANKANGGEDKPNFVTNEANVERNIAMENWKLVT